MIRRIEVDLELAPVELAADLLNEVFAHAREADPEECCGLITGDDRVRHRHVVRCRNDMTRHHRRDPSRFPRDGRQGFYMNEHDYQRAERDARERGEQVTAVYHSHVECGAYFSEMDQDFAQQELFPFPEADHLVVSVVGGKVVDQALFQPDRARATFVGRGVVLATP